MNHLLVFTDFERCAEIVDVATRGYVEASIDESRRENTLKCDANSIEDYSRWRRGIKVMAMRCKDFLLMNRCSLRCRFAVLLSFLQVEAILRIWN
ncbi:hypothetical protein RYX36_013512 [Vicia faba]